MKLMEMAAGMAGGMSGQLLEMSLSGAVLILVIIIIRAVLIGRLPKTTFTALWKIALLRLLLPFSIPSMFSIYSWVNGSALAGKVSAGVPAGGFPVETAADFIPAAAAGWIGLNAPSARMQVQQGRTLASACFIIWCAGMAACAAYFVVSYLRCRLEFQTALPVTNAFADEWLLQHRRNRAVSIRQSDKITAPLTYGVLRPVILMPKKMDWENTQQLQYVLLHEYVHICRFDAAVKLIAACALCMHWFNPMVWAMYFLFNRDMELACDERVVKQSGENSRSAYALTLIGMEERKAGMTLLCNNFSKNAMEERIRSIMKYKKKTFITATAAMLLTASIGAVFATTAGETEASSMLPSRADFVAVFATTAGETEAAGEPAARVSQSGAPASLSKGSTDKAGTKNVSAARTNRTAGSTSAAYTEENDKDAAVETAAAFWQAYLSRNTEALKQYLAEDYQGNLDVFPVPDGEADSEYDAQKAQLLSVKGLDFEKKDIGETCEASIEFKPGAEGASYRYLSIEMVKYQDGWKIRWYGLEG